MSQILRKRGLEKGQVIPIIVIMFFAIVGMTALILDGGSVMVSRRSIQAAADSGAMAGATELCYSTGADPLTVAENFAANNGATTATAEYVGGAVKVTATMTYDSFFAKVFNQDNLSASAEATAGCFPPSGNNLLPVAWSCRPPVGGGVFDSDKGCQIMALDWNNLLRPLLENEVSTISIPGNDGLFEKVGDNIRNVDTNKPPSQIYIIMDAISTNKETICKENLDPSDPLYDTAITCDLDGNGKMDIEGAGNRGWLDLDGGGGGANELKDWVRYGFNGTILPHTWLAGEPGQKTAVFPVVRDFRVGDVMMIPVFNALCDNKNPLSNQACMDAAHASPFPPEPPVTGDIADSGHKPNFHIITFTPFYISCVHVKKTDDCPGFELAQAMNPSVIDDNIPAIEGFFLENVNVQLDLLQVCGVNLGNCEVSLMD